MGVYHQGGVVPAQIWLGQQHDLGVEEVFWWKTYSPPVWLLGQNEMNTTDLMGMKAGDMIQRVHGAIGLCDGEGVKSAGLVAPRSSVELDAWMGRDSGSMTFEELSMTPNHLNLDDMDFEDDGLLGTWNRVVGRRGLVIWKVTRRCTWIAP